MSRRAYQKLQFSNKILSVEFLSERFHISITSDLPAKNDRGICIIPSRSDGKPDFTRIITEWLYTVKFDEDTQPLAGVQSKEQCSFCLHSSLRRILFSNGSSPIEWHQIPKLISPDHLFEDTKIYPAIPYFSLKTILTYSVSII